MTAIKMCGFTRLEDAQAAASMGVHALGFVLWPGSPRCVDLQTVGRIVVGLPPFVTPVGVFVNPTADAIARAAQEGGIRVAQVYGVVPPFATGGAPVAILRAVHLADGAGAELDSDVAPDVPVLLDAHDPVRHGGTGRVADWTRAAMVARSRVVVLAGGLTPANVAAAIDTVRPYGVDVASGVETRPGVKDPLLMRQFIDAIHKKEPASFLRDT